MAISEQNSAIIELFQNENNKVLNSHLESLGIIEEHLLRASREQIDPDTAVCLALSIIEIKRDLEMLKGENMS